MILWWNLFLIESIFVFMFKIISFFELDFDMPPILLPFVIW